MKKRILYLVTLFIAFIGVFLIQKPLFMLYNYSEELSVTDYIQVILHGFSLDAATAGYLTIIPLIVLLASIWTKKMNLRKWMRPYLIIISLIISIVFVIDMALYAFWQFKLDATIFNYLDSPSEAFASVSTGYILLRFVAVIIVTILTAWLFIHITPKKLEKCNKHRLSGTILTLLLAGGLFIIIRGGTTESTSNIGQVYYSDNQFLNHSAVNPCFSLLSSIGKNEKFEDMYEFFPEEERAKLFEGLYTISDSTTIKLLNTERPNILVILLEGFGSVLVESQGGIQGASPHIDSLRKEGVFFSNLYANSYRTDRGTVCTFSGYPGLPKTSVMKIPAKSRTLPAMAKTLRNAGYETDFLYGGDINFTNMKSFLLSSGYQKITADTDFTLAERKTNAWGVNDDITFNHLYQEISERKDTTKRWFTTFLTLSSHEPFEVPFSKFENDPIRNSFAYTDNCLGNFINKLKQLPQWDNLLIICIPDHSLIYNLKQPDDRFRIPMLWIGGAVKSSKNIETIANQTDLPATLFGQLGLPHDDFTFSRNILGNKYTYPFAFFTFNDALGFRDTTGITIFDNESGKTTTDIPVSSTNRLKGGQAILQTVMDDFGKR